MGNVLRTKKGFWESLAGLIKTKKKKAKRSIKDQLFRLVFGSDKEALLCLYNAINKTNYKNIEDLQVVTLEGALYISMKNDIAFIIAGTINLYEHQSTNNPNIPVRMLIYLSQEYQLYLEALERSMYGTSLVKLPAPRCVVFYNGLDELPDISELRLSDAFAVEKDDSSVELKVKVININHGRNSELLAACEKLSQYAQCVRIIRDYMSKANGSSGEKISNALDYCIENDILKDILSKHRMEVLGMWLEEFDEEKYKRTIEADARDKGMQQQRELLIRDMLGRGKSPEEIAEFTGIDINEIRAVKI